jgi:putative ABC transport system substrate-binding protein
LVIFKEPSKESFPEWWSVFLPELAVRGWREGKELTIDYRWADGDVKRLPSLAAELLEQKPDLIITYGLAGLEAVHQRSSTVPVIIGAGIEDPIKLGLAETQGRPTANVSGLLDQPLSLMNEKTREMYKEALPSLQKLGVLWDARYGTYEETGLPFSVAAARALGTELSGVNVRSVGELQRAISDAKAAGVQALQTQAFTLFIDHHREIAEISQQQGLPIASNWPVLTRAGGLFSFAQDEAANWKLMADYVDRVLKGEAVAAIPFRRVDKFSVIVNLKAARQLGLAFPASFLARVTETVE